MAKFINNGAVELYHNNVKKFETTSAGAHVWGNLDFMDNAKLRLGTGTDLEIYHDGTDNIIDCKNDKNLKIVNDAGGGNETMVLCDPNGAVELYYNNAKKLETTSAGGTLTGTWSGAGKILQVIQTVKTDTFSTTSSNGSYSDVTGLAASITPSSSSNKILVTVSVNGGGSGWANYYKLYRGSTALGVGDDFGGSSSQSTFGSDGDQAPDSTNTSTYMYLDSPSSTSSTTYKIAVGHRSTGTAYINRPSVTSNQDWAYSASSTITLQEVSA